MFAFERMCVCVRECACGRRVYVCVHTTSALFVSLMFAFYPFCSKAIREMKLLAETFGAIKLVQARYNAAYT